MPYQCGGSSRLFDSRSRKASRSKGLRNEGLRAKDKSDLLLSVISILLLILSVCFLFCFGFF